MEDDVFHSPTGNSFETRNIDRTSRHSKMSVAYQDRVNPGRKERYLKALGMRNAGKTYREIGEALGVSHTRAAQLVHKAKRMRY